MLFKTPELMQKKIDEYFAKECKDDYAKDENGNILRDSKGNAVIRHNPPTFSGLTLYLGYLDRASFYDVLERDDKYSHIIKKAIKKIENYAERQLFHGNTTGAIFWLKNRGDNWRDRNEVDLSGQVKLKTVPFKVDDEE